MPNFHQISQSTAEILLHPIPKSNGRQIGILLPVSILTCLSSSAFHFCISQPNWSKSIHPSQSYNGILIFKMAAGSHIKFDFGNGRPPTTCCRCLSLVLTFGLDWIYSFRDIVIYISSFNFLAFASYANYGSFEVTFSSEKWRHPLS